MVEQSHCPSPGHFARADSRALTLWQSAHHLLVIKQCMQETLHLYPPVAVGQIRCDLHNDVVLAGRLTLPRGPNPTSLILSCACRRRCGCTRRWQWARSAATCTGMWCWRGA